MDKLNNVYDLMQNGVHCGTIERNIISKGKQYDAIINLLTKNILLINEYGATALCLINIEKYGDQQDLNQAIIHMIQETNKAISTLLEY